MTRTLRIVLAALMFIGITLLFAGIGGGWWGWMAKIQFIPSLMALNAAVIVGLALLTLLFGRLYCSVICPLGIFQDLFFSLRRKLEPKRRQSFSPERKWLRYGVFTLFAVCFFCGVQVIVVLLAPYSAYGRIVSSIIGTEGWIVPTVAGLTAVALALLAWTGGRTYCNNICPVGTLLGMLSRISLFRPVFDEKACIRCGRCENICRSSCIDAKNGMIDSSRCVDCFDCISECKFKGIRYRFAYGRGKAAIDGKPAADQGRRAFLTGAFLAGTSIALNAQGQKLDGGLAPIIRKTSPVRTSPVVPPGAQGLSRFYDKCTACQLCIRACPNDVLHPSGDLEHLMQPFMSFEKGYCRTECTACGDICPSGAILPVTAEQKTSIHIGTALIDYDLCLASSEGVDCGNCARHCPASAIMMGKGEGKPGSGIPYVNESKCIGCGACEHLCPVRPVSAIHVNGLADHIKD